MKGKLTKVKSVTLRTKKCESLAEKTIDEKIGESVAGKTTNEKMAKVKSVTLPTKNDESLFSERKNGESLVGDTTNEKN